MNKSGASAHDLKARWWLSLQCGGEAILDAPETTDMQHRADRALHKGAFQSKERATRKPLRHFHG